MSNRVVANSISLEALATLATSRNESLFEGDFQRVIATHGCDVHGAKVLVIGGAGSIGSATVRLLVNHDLEQLDIVDTNENGLAELIRDLRASGRPLGPRSIGLYPLDFGSPIMSRFLRIYGPYDFVLNFAAIKHVRSEKDICAQLQMLSTNVLKQAHLLNGLEATGFRGRYFSVSTDKAANPVNVLGASKRLMEHVMFCPEVCRAASSVRSTARFANVAFSDGSLLHGWVERMRKQQPLAVPAATKRFFVSMAEAGQICMVAALAGPPNECIVPRLNPEEHLVDLVDVALRFVRANGFEPVTYESEQEAIGAVSSDIGRGKYPVLVTRLDTMGEKPFEEFSGEGESVTEVGMRSLQTVAYRCANDPAQVAYVIARLNEFVGNATLKLSVQDIDNLLERVLPEYRHLTSSRRLDDRV